jgi:hypothetical protein
MRVSEAKGCKPFPRICEANRRVKFYIRYFLIISDLKKDS